MKTKPPAEESLIETLMHNFNKDKYLIRIEYNADSDTYSRHDSWSSMKSSTICRMGYVEAEKFHDDLRYIGVKTYIRLVGFKESEAPDLETSSTLEDFYSSKAIEDFGRGLTPVKFASMDKKTLITLVPILIGAVLGIYFLFFRR